MEISKDIIRDILIAQDKVISQIYRDGMTLDDFTNEDIIEMIYEEM